jgi:membrane associated rhomboid family serine protease
VIYGLGSSLLSALFLQLRFSVGASGAIAGLIGGKLSHLLTNWKIHDDKVNK